MTSWRYGAAVTAVLFGGLVCLPAAAPLENGQRPAAVAPQETPPRRTTPAQAGPQSAKAWDTLGMRGFSVALVVGDLAGAATPDNLPAGAKKALSDMRDFLPYKSYRLLDTHWILCCSGSSAASVAGRLRGAEEEEYSFYIDARPNTDQGEIAVRFNLREAGVTANTVTSMVETERARAAQAMRERDEAARRASQGSQADQAAARAQYEDLKRQAQELERAARATSTSSRSRPVLDSTFSMKVGETVVIGTSRLKGDKALIALLTAASKNSTPSAR
jgi:hypothetical protein